MTVLRASSFRAPASLVGRRPSIALSELIEEETLPKYRPDDYYPVEIGQTIYDRYKVLAKLGFGSSSTTWLAQDTSRWKLQSNRFVTLKVLTRTAKSHPSTCSELVLSKLIAEAAPKNTGLRYLRTVSDSFQIQGQFGSHLCLVYTVMREDLSTFQRRLQGRRIPSNLLKPMLKYMLSGLDYLHTKCHIVHTDLKPENILIGTESSQIINELIAEEARQPTPVKRLPDRCIYAHRNFGNLIGIPGHPKIADFGLAVRMSGDLQYHPIQPDLLQAPEVILQAGWTYSADIWNLGVMIWDLLEGHALFTAQDPATDTYRVDIHLAEMQSLLGPPPGDLLRLGKMTDQYFTSEGNLNSRSTSTILCTDIADTVQALTGSDKRNFVRFVTRMLQWSPDRRATARELLEDPWLLAKTGSQRG